MISTMLGSCELAMLSKMGATQSRDDGTASVTVHLTVALDDEGRPVGVIAENGAGPVPFTGWLALTAELSRRLANGTITHPPPSARVRPG